MLQLILLTSTLSLLISSYVLWRIMPRTKKRAGTAVLLDTSALMDGRIIEVVKSGFVPAELLIPRFVIAELQLLADKADHLKRERARFGLQIIQDLQDSRYGEVTIISDDIKEESGVDEKLVKLAVKRGALLFTTDFNLLKVAEIEGVRVLNINELAHNLRPARIPGEQSEIKIVGKGQERSQGVGYLDDGTLVVVENAGYSHNKVVKVEFTRNLQTTAGRMMFAKLIEQPKSVPRQAPKASQPRPEKPKFTNPRRKLSYREQAEDNLISAIESK